MHVARICDGSCLDEILSGFPLCAVCGSDRRYRWWQPDPMLKRSGVCDGGRADFPLEKF
jgi:hypothetical protein